VTVPDPGASPLADDGDRARARPATSGAPAG
jgi:hypothetical protein